MSLEDEIRRIVREELAKLQPANDSAPSEYVTVAEYARARSISESTVRQAIADKRIESILIGRSRRIPANASIAKRTVATADDFTARARLVLLGGGKAR